jgi:hypothetical protein
LPKFRVCALVAIGLTATASADTTINSTNHYAYGANVGWIEARGDITNGAVIGEYVCAGYLYGANIGWINLGGGVPTSGVRYGNAAANDFGVNHDAYGNLTGYAYGANVGWITFETNYGKPRVNLLTGQMDGYVYGANIGWISLSNAQAFVETDEVRKGVDTDGDGITDAWELDRTNTLTAFAATTDGDADGSPDFAEYRAGTDPYDSASVLDIQQFQLLGNASTSRVTWASQLTRFYYVDKANGVTNTSWSDSGLDLESPDGATTTRDFADSATSRIYRVRAVRPLTP